MAGMETFRKLEQEHATLRSKFSQLAAWLQLKFHDDPTFPVYLLQDLPIEETITVKVKIEPIDTFAVADSLLNIRIKKEDVSEHNERSSERDSNFAVSSKKGRKRMNPEAGGSSAGPPNHYCTICHFSFEAELSLLLHNGEFHPLKRKTPPEPKFDQVCPKCGAHVAKLAKHMAKFHNLKAEWKKAKQEAKEARIQKNRELTRVGIVARIACPECGAQFSRNSVQQGRYHQHITKKHGNNVVDINSEQALTACGFCNVSVKRFNYQKHLNKHHPELKMELHERCK